jgi:hypothetical protein
METSLDDDGADDDDDICYTVYEKAQLHQFWCEKWVHLKFGVHCSYNIQYIPE